MKTNPASCLLGNSRSRGAGGSRTSAEQADDAGSEGVGGASGMKTSLGFRVDPLVAGEAAPSAPTGRGGGYRAS